MGLAEIIKTMRIIDSNEFRWTLVGKMMLEISRLIDEGFEETHDPDGRQWASRLNKKTQHPLLQETGEMRESIKAKVIPGNAGFVITAIDRARFHQRGTRNMAARKMFPRSGDNLPPRWEEVLRLVADEALRSIQSGAI